jgi:hypothetical protein
MCILAIYKSMFFLFSGSAYTLQWVECGLCICRDSEFEKILLVLYIYITNHLCRCVPWC